jgi:DNA adenine methylase
MVMALAPKHNEKTVLRPPLKWAGGKRWLVPHLRSYWNRFSDRRLVELFCGGLSVSMGLLPKIALLNDINPHLINFFTWVSKGFQIEIDMENDKALYYSHRRRFNELILEGSITSKQAAELFYYLNRTGYNGLCRFNKSGEFNVPFGRYKAINYRRDFSCYKPLFRSWELMSTDFQKVPIEPLDFVYADPPYDVEFTQYSKEGFGWEDQIRLANWLAKHPGPVLISNQATSRIVKLYEHLGFNIHYLDGPRMISCTGDRSTAREVIASKGV